MKPTFLLLCGVMAFAGCADHARSAYRDPGSINKYSRHNMRVTEREIPMPPIHPGRVTTYADYGPPRPAGSPYVDYTGRPPTLMSEVVAPPTSPGLYGPVADSPSASEGSGFGGRRFREGARDRYSGYYPAYGYGW